jgi:hypothetical protein
VNLVAMQAAGRAAGRVVNIAGGKTPTTIEAGVERNVAWFRDRVPLMG